MFGFSVKKMFTGRLIFFYLFFFILTLFVANNAFFWDTIQLASKHAHFYYENNLTLELLPDNIDSGHIPFFGYLLAVIWKFFGYSLVSSHFLMLPFLLAIVYHTNKLIQFYIPEKLSILALALVLADPTLLAQSTLVSPDIPLMLFFFMLLNGILYSKNYLKVIAVIGLSLISMRGWMVATIFFIFEIIIRHKNIRSFKELANLIYPYLPGGIIALSFLLIHLISKGWVGYHSDSPWSGSFEIVNLKGFIFNTGIYIWRLIDFGRVIWWVVLLLLLKLFYSRLRKDTKLKNIVILLSLFLFIYPISLLMHRHLLQPRYFLPVFILVSLVACIVLFNHTSKKYIAFIVLTVLLLGNLIVYPDKIAQGWDASLAHLPYFSLRKDAINYLNKNNIDVNNTKCWFPNLASFKHTDLKSDSNYFSAAPLKNTKYCLYSNIYNDISDEEYKQLYSNWNLLYDNSLMQVKIQIFENPQILYYSE